MTDEPQRFVEVPLERLDDATLRRLVEEFVTRDGTDYGTAEKTLEQKVADVMRQLRRGEARVVFDVEMQAANVVVGGRFPVAGP